MLSVCAKDALALLCLDKPAAAASAAMDTALLLVPKASFAVPPSLRTNNPPPSPLTPSTQPSSKKNRWTTIFLNLATISISWKKSA